MQLVVLNLCDSALTLQILAEIPEGSIPLMSHDYTKILNPRVD